MGLCPEATKRPEYSTSRTTIRVDDTIRIILYVPYSGEPLEIRRVDEVSIALNNQNTRPVVLKYWGCHGAVTTDQRLIAAESQRLLYEDVCGLRRKEGDGSGGL